MKIPKPEQNPGFTDLTAVTLSWSMNLSVPVLSFINRGLETDMYSMHVWFHCIKGYKVPNGALNLSVLY